MEISIIEFIVYGIIAYGSAIVLAVSAIKDVQATRSQSLSRVIYMIPGFIAAIVLAGSGVDITLESTFTESYLNAYNDTTGLYDSTDRWYENVTKTGEYTLNNPVWITFHYMLAIVFFIYIIIQVLSMLLFKD